MDTALRHSFQKAGKAYPLPQPLLSEHSLLRLGWLCKAALCIHHTFSAGLPAPAGHLYPMGAVQKPAYLPAWLDEKRFSIHKKADLCLIAFHF